MRFKVLKLVIMLKNSPILPDGFIKKSKDMKVLPMVIFLRKNKMNELS